MIEIGRFWYCFQSVQRRMCNRYPLIPLLKLQTLAPEFSTLLQPPYSGSPHDSIMQIGNLLITPSYCCKPLTLPKCASLGNQIFCIKDKKWNNMTQVMDYDRFTYISGTSNNLLCWCFRASTNTYLILTSMNCATLEMSIITFGVVDTITYAIKKS